MMVMHEKSMIVTTQITVNNDHIDKIGYECKKN